MSKENVLDINGRILKKQTEEGKKAAREALYNKGITAGTYMQQFPPRPTLTVEDFTRIVESDFDLENMEALPFIDPAFTNAIAGMEIVTAVEDITATDLFTAWLMTDKSPYQMALWLAHKHNTYITEETMHSLSELSYAASDFQDQLVSEWTEAHDISYENSEFVFGEMYAVVCEFNDSVFFGELDDFDDDSATAIFLPLIIDNGNFASHGLFTDMEVPAENLCIPTEETLERIANILKRKDGVTFEMLKKEEFLARQEIFNKDD